MLPAPSAKYNSSASNDIRRVKCTPGTREPQIKALLTWARAPQAGKTYWMNGMAGTGKTTIAYSCTAVREDMSMLGASFFCSRVISECCQVKNIIPTIAYQLARYSMPFYYALYQVLESEPDVCTGALNIQYQNLIVKPLTIMQRSLPEDFIVVIDALDECENANSLGDILDLLMSTPLSLPIRFLVSSRPEPAI
ncbi:hypothetical protein B0J17DRAFT_584713, partial [Rhizoctonia solani]